MTEWAWPTASRTAWNAALSTAAARSRSTFLIRSIAWEVIRATSRSAFRSSGVAAIGEVARNSIVATTCSPITIGNAAPDHRPLERAGELTARSPRRFRSETITRSRDCQARPPSPSPTRWWACARASSKSPWSEPDPVTNRSVPSAGSTVR